MPKNSDLETALEAAITPKSALTSRNVKPGLSSTVMNENNKVVEQIELQRSAVGDSQLKSYRAEILHTDADEMLQKVSKELKMTDYTLSRIVTSGTDHFIRLKTTTVEEVNTYRDYLHAVKHANEKQRKRLPAMMPSPFTRLEIIGYPIQCKVMAENKRGHCKLIIRGKVPDDLTLYASEVYQDPNETNYTWMLTKPRTVLFNLADTKAAQNAKMNKTGKNNNESGVQ